MRRLVSPQVLVVAASLLAVPLASARGQLVLLDEPAIVSSTVYVEPASVLVPTSSVSYVPTATVVRARPLYYSTTYTPTVLSYSPSYVRTSALLTPAWRRTSWVVPTSTVYYPTVSRLLATSFSSDCCDTVPVVTAPVAVPSLDCEVDSGVIVDDGAVISEAPASSPSAPAASSPSGGAESGSKSAEPGFTNPNVIRSQPENQSAEPATSPAPSTSPVPNNTGTEPEASLGSRPSSATAPAATAPAIDELPPPAEATVPPEQPAPGAATPGLLPPSPVAPTPDELPGGGLLEEDPTPSPIEPTTRQAQRPVMTDPAVSRASTARSVLRGRVVSADTGAPETGLAVTLSDAQARFKDRVLRTNDKGEFSVSLPEGDWTVKVAKVGAKADDPEATLDVPVTVAGGLITDTNDREVTVLTINR